MIDLSLKSSRKFKNVQDIPQLLTTIIEHQHIHCRCMKYIQFVLYDRPNIGRFLDSVILNGYDRGRIWWKEKIEREYHNVKWLHDTYENSLKIYDEYQIHMMLTGSELGI